MGNDTSFVNSDAAFDSDGNLVALDYGSAMLALTQVDVTLAVDRYLRLRQP
jgi:hypothetical protein